MRTKKIQFPGLFILSLVLTMQAFSQSTNVILKGSVTGASNEKLAFATIAVKGTTQGTLTDESGNYILEIPIPCILKISMTGYITQEKEIRVAGNYDFNLAEDSKLLDQVVVIGYGTTKKSDLTGSSSTIKASDIRNIPSLTVTEAIQGKVAGVSIINSGAPGTSPKVRIRGVGSILGGADPLYVVDGVITTDIRNLNSNDIVTIDVLKDASSTAIYGARAANGVILITTASDSKKKFKVNYDNQLGMRLLINSVKMSPPGYYAQYANDAAEFPAITQGDVTGTTDWYDQITRPAFFHNHNLSMSGKINNYTYYFSSGLLQVNGILLDNNYNRYTLRYNHEYKLNKNIKLGNTLSYSRFIANNKPYSVFTQAYIAAPIFNAVNPDGTFGNTSNVINNVGNPYATIKTVNDRSYGNRYQGTLFGTYHFLKHLDFKSQVGLDIENNNGWEYLEQYYTYQANGIQGGQQNEKADLRFNRDTIYQWVWDNTLSFTKTFGSEHEFKFMLGHTAERRDGWMSKATITNYDIPNDESYWKLNFTDTSRGQQNLRDPIENYFRRESYFARLNYKLLERYLLNATIRRDANSNFPANNRWASFPSIGLGWILSQENFMQSVNIVDELKIRVSFGLVGNDVIRPGQFDLRPTERLFTYFGTDRIDGATVTGIVDPNLKWEVVTEYDFGIEFSLLKQRFVGELDFYHKKAQDALYTIPYASLGFGNSLLTNAADVLNYGVELGIKYRLPAKNEFTQVVSYTITYNKNVVDNVGLGRALNFGSLGNGSTATQTLEGYEIGSFWVYRTDGIFQNEEEIKAYPHIINTKPGDLRLKDLNNDGIIDNLDREHIGSYQPKFMIGMNYAVTWKNWDASIDLFSLLGNKVYNAKKGIRFGSNYNVELDVAKNRWVPGSNENKNPRASNTTPFPSDYFVESGSFFRINNVTIGYKLDANKFWRSIETLRFFIGAQNPLLLTKYTGFTPELPGNQNEAGIELNIYPVSAVFLFGLNVTFK